MIEKVFLLLCDKLLHCLIFGTLYFLLESAYKGQWTNYRMWILSGLIGLMIGIINELFSFDTDFILQCIIGMLIALVCECIFGYQWNVLEGLGLWDYSSLPFSYSADQINGIFAVLWFFLSGICIVLDDVIHYYICKDTSFQPYYKIFGRTLRLPI